ncbi:MAG TPA: AtpZ/AtpI family protein [Candidatus Paceibacterota bacterium]|nr:AtpZ/AtpI family protein [Candidatus Pacearchaeota archaeon]HRZ51067.1 AtpZ/AtpI family protein [Candidatus Paceibacterota bacterium]HSA36774.1 AtpZ/AtpI family protein [Candidatus Paceibacterota bacterium]
MDEDRQKLAYILGMGMQLGLMIALTMAGLLVLGVYLDKLLATKPLLTILGVVMGFLGAGLEMRYVVLPVLEKKNKADDKTIAGPNKEKRPET